MKAQIGSFVAGLAAFFLMAAMGLTPLAWRLQGRPSESYPEILFLALGLPLGAIAVMAGALLAWNATNRAPSKRARPL